MKSLVLALTALLSVNAFGATAVTAETCDLIGGNDRIACYQDVYAQEDSYMQGVYDGIQARALPEIAKAVKDAQRKWLAFRDSTCAAEALVNKRAGQPANTIVCLAKRTFERNFEITELSQLINDKNEVD